MTEDMFPDASGTMLNAYMESEHFDDLKSPQNADSYRKYANLVAP